MVEGQETASANHRPRSGVPQFGHPLEHAARGRAVARQVVATQHREGRDTRRASAPQGLDDEARRASRRFRLREIVNDVRVALDELASRRIMAIALLRDGQADDPDIRCAHRCKQACGSSGATRSSRQRADDAEILPAGASHGDRIEPVLRLQARRACRRPQACPADRPVRFARREPVVENDRLMRAMKGADAEVDDADPDRVEIVARARDVAGQRVEAAF